MPAVIVDAAPAVPVAPAVSQAVVVQTGRDCAVEVVAPDRVAPAPAWVAALAVALRETA